MLRNALLFTATGALLVLNACAPGQPINQSQYWQRVSPSESLYSQGPKAEEMLKRDIGRCIVELKELESLGVVKNSVKTDPKGRVLDPHERIHHPDIPKKNAILKPDEKTFVDFDGCMMSKGWERVYVHGNTIHN